MRHDEFLAQVQRRAQLPSRDDADRATYATLETLGERLTGDEAKDLAAQLPPELARYTLSTGRGTGESFPIDEFFRRVSNRERVNLSDATLHANAVMNVLQEVVSPGEINDIRSQLPSEYNRLFEARGQEER